MTHGKIIVPIHFKVRRPGHDVHNSNKSSANTSNVDSAYDDNPSCLDPNGSPFIGRLRGRAHEGKWQIEHVYVPTDPRDASRRTGVGATTEMISTFARAVAKASVEEEFPALPSDSRTMNAMLLWVHSSTATIGGKNGRKGNKRDNDFPILSAVVLKPAPSSSVKPKTCSIVSSKSISQAFLTLTTKSNPSEMSYAQIPRASSSSFSDRELSSSP